MEEFSDPLPCGDGVPSSYIYLVPPSFFYQLISEFFLPGQRFTAGSVRKTSASYTMQRSLPIAPSLREDLFSELVRPATRPGATRPDLRQHVRLVMSPESAKEAGMEPAEIKKMGGFLLRLGEHVALHRGLTGEVRERVVKAAAKLLDVADLKQKNRKVRLAAVARQPPMPRAVSHFGVEW